MEQLFLTILNRAVTAGWLVLLVMVLRVVLKKAPRAARYGLWAIVAVRLLWPGDLLPRAGVSLVPTTEPISGDVLTAAGTAVSGGLPAVGSPAGAAAAETAARTGQSLGHIAAVVWLVGMAAMALYLAGSYVRLRVRLRTAVRLEDGVWESEQAPSPFVLGFIRPRIYLPFGLDRGSRDYVLAHERTHIRHRDHWVKPLAFLLLAVYWFNPLLWAAYILLCRDMEYACDEAVLRDLEEPDKRAYSQALLNCAGPRRAVTACPVAFGEVCVKGRIRRALRYKKPAVWVTAAAVVVCAAAAVCLLTNPRDRTPYGWASRVTAGGLNVTYLCEGNSAQTPAGMPGLTSRLAEQLNGLTEEDFPLLENYAYNIFDQGREPFRLQMGRTAGKRELLYGGDSGYPLMLLYRGKLYGVNSEELLQTILEYTRGVQVVPAGTELALRMGLPGVYRMMTKENADGPDVIQGDDFSWTPAAWQGGMAYVHSQIPGPGASSGSVRRAIGAVRTGKQGADMRAVLQGQAGCQRHFLIAPSPAPAAERHRRLTTGQQAERLCIRRQFGRHPPGLRHQQGRLLPGFPHHFVRQDDRTEALLPGLLRRRIQGLPVGGDQGILHMPEQGIPRLGRLGILTQTAFLKMIQDSRRHGRCQLVAGKDVHAVRKRRSIRRCGT